MKPVSFTTLIAEKQDELRTQKNELLKRYQLPETDPLRISKNTMQTQRYHKDCDIATLSLIKELLANTDESKLSEESRKVLVHLTTLTEERSSTRYDIKAGDAVMDVLMKYENLNKKKLVEWLAKRNLKLSADEATIESTIEDADDTSDEAAV